MDSSLVSPALPLSDPPFFPLYSLPPLPPPLLTLSSLLPPESISLKMSLLLWLIFGVCCLALLYLKSYFKQAVVVVGCIAIIRAIITLGIQPTFSVLGFLQVTMCSPLCSVHDSGHWVCTCIGHALCLLMLEPILCHVHEKIVFRRSCATVTYCS